MCIKCGPLEYTLNTFSMVTIPLWPQGMLLPWGCLEAGKSTCACRYAKGKRGNLFTELFVVWRLVLLNEWWGYGKPIYLLYHYHNGKSMGTVLIDINGKYGSMIDDLKLFHANGDQRCRLVDVDNGYWRKGDTHHTSNLFEQMKETNQKAKIYVCMSM